MFWMVPLAAAAAGAYMGNQEQQRKQKVEDRTRAANADATEVSWARKDGRGQIPEINWNDMGSSAGATFKGAVGGGMAGMSLASGMNGAPAKPEAAPMDPGHSDPFGEGMDWNALGGSGFARTQGNQAPNLYTRKQYAMGSF